MNNLIGLPKFQNLRKIRKKIRQIELALRCSFNLTIFFLNMLFIKNWLTIGPLFEEPKIRYLIAQKQKPTAHPFRNRDRTLSSIEMIAQNQNHC